MSQAGINEIFLSTGVSGLNLEAVGFPHWIEVECSHSPRLELGTVSAEGRRSKPKQEGGRGLAVFGVCWREVKHGLGVLGRSHSQQGSGRYCAERSSTIWESRFVRAGENPCHSTQIWLWYSALPAIPDGNWELFPAWERAQGG